MQEEIVVSYKELSTAGIESLINELEYKKMKKQGGEFPIDDGKPQSSEAKDMIITIKLPNEEEDDKSVQLDDVEYMLMSLEVKYNKADQWMRQSILYDNTVYYNFIMFDALRGLLTGADMKDIDTVLNKGGLNWFKDTSVPQPGEGWGLTTVKKHAVDLIQDKVFEDDE